MKAVTFHDVGNLQVDTVPDPVILQPTDAIVKVHLAGVCGSDLHVYHGRETGLDVGTVMGHELFGEIVALGSEVKKLRVGQQVMSPFTTSCGHCDFCRMGLTCRCREGGLFGWVAQGKGLQGAQAEYVRVPWAQGSLVPVPEGLDQELALLMGDVIPTGYFCADMAGINPAGTYVVLGCGPVGLMAVMGCFALGAEKVYAVDRVPERLAIARSFGAEPLSLDQDHLQERLLDVTNGRGADAVLEVVGSPQASRLAFDLVRPGGTISTVGVHTTPSFSFSPVEAYDKNLTFKIGRCPARHYMERLLPLVQSGRWDLKKVISHRLNLDQGKEAYRLFDEKREGCTKAILQAF